MYGGLLTSDNLESRRGEVITVNNRKYAGYYFSKENGDFTDTYFIKKEDFRNVKLPVKVKGSQEADYKGKLFYFVTGLSSVAIPETKKMSFKALVDSFCHFQHSNPSDWLMYRILSIVSWISRINYRVISEAGFGKDCTTNAKQSILGGVSNMVKATRAKLEYELRNDDLFFNEIADMKKDDLLEMQTFLLKCGDYSPEYIKQTRKTDVTSEQYDLSNKSIIIAHNPNNYYKSVGQKGFEDMFTTAVKDRFIPFLFKGRIQINTPENFDKNVVLEDHKDYIKDFISTMTYFKKNPLKECEYKLKEYDFGNRERHRESFIYLARWVAEYCVTKEEFNIMMNLFYKRHTDYLNTGTEEEVEFIDMTNVK